MIERILEATGLDDIGLFIARLINFSLFFVGIMWIGYWRGWWTGSNDWEEGRMGWKRAVLIFLICRILTHLMIFGIDIVQKKFWNNSQEENVVETQTNLVEE